MNDAVTSRPIDPDQLAARLNRVADNQDAVPQALSRLSRYERTPTAEVDWDANAKRDETIAYNTLINDGGRPVYPISRLEEVFKGLEEYHEMLRPWNDFSSHDWHEVFRNQLYRWKMFRRWQQDNREPVAEMEFAAYLEEQKRQDAEGTVIRPTASQYLEQLRDSYERRQRYYGHDDGDEGFAAYVEQKKQENFQSGRQWPGMTKDEYMQMLRDQFKKQQAKEGIEDGDEGFAAFVEGKKQKDMEAGRRWPGMTEDEYRKMHRGRFDREQADHYWREFCRLREDHGRGGFSEYVAEAKRRLARHGFTEALQFERDPTRQDKLTTWIEYLNYECSWLDQHARRLTNLQPDYDKGWQKLVTSGVLRRGETAAGFCTMESAIRCQSERDAAKMAVDHAEQAGMEVLEKVMNDPKSRSKLPKPLRIKMMKQATFRVEAAKASLRKVATRCDLISEFVRGASEYRATEKNLTLQRIRLQWVREQIPLIEAELREAETAGNCLRTRRKTKRKLEDDQHDDDANGRIKRKKQSHQAGSLMDDLGSSTRAKASKHSRLAQPKDRQPHRESRSDRKSSNVQQVFKDVNTASTGTSQPTVTRTTKRRAGGAKTGLNASRESGHRQLRSSTVQPQAPKQVRRSPRFATAQDKSGEGTVLRSGATRSSLRSHPKTASAMAPHT